MAKNKHKKKRKKQRYSSLNAHKRAGKQLLAPLAQFDPWNPSPWVDDRLPEMLWAVLVVSVLRREEALEIFRRVAECAEIYRDVEEKITIGVTQSILAVIDEGQFRRVVAVPLSHPLGLVSLRPLLLFPELPGYARWEAALACAPSPEEDWQRLGKAVMATLDHQSQESTDCRWLTVFFHAAAGKVYLPYEREDLARELDNYPHYGDQRKVRPTIRAMEMGLRNSEEVKSDWPRVFWDRCFRQTGCLLSEQAGSGIGTKPGTTLDRVHQVRDHLQDHLVQTATTSAVDACHDTSFGFCLYALALLVELLRVGNAQSILGRCALRSLVECLITFRYLAKKNDQELWRSYRVYGAGQAKLAFLKLEEATGDVPDSIDWQTLENLANEDVYQEFLPINLGHWDNSNLRKLAEETGCKDIYDAYYTWTSSFIHGHWGPMRDVCFTTCLNPLHRLHRIPRPTARTLEDVVPDACTLVDSIFETLDAVYSGFAARVTL